MLSSCKRICYSLMKDLALKTYQLLNVCFGISPPKKHCKVARFYYQLRPLFVLCYLSMTKLLIFSSDFISLVFKSCFYQFLSVSGKIGRAYSFLKFENLNYLTFFHVMSSRL